MISIDDFTEERECLYRGEHYSVRDNGAILRHSQEGKACRKKDNIWTFGDKPHQGYIYYCNVPVHRVVATAFCGKAPTQQHVVDHIDTNRQNNRPENLRWLTKLENILNNEITRRRVEYICGSIEAFLKNPSLLFNHESVDPNFSWMRRVSKEEAKNALENMKDWYKQNPERSSSGAGYGEWIFENRTETKGYSLEKTDEINKQDESHNSNELTWDIIEQALGGKKTKEKNISVPEVAFDTPAEEEGFQHLLELPDLEYKDSLTPNALQHIAWKTPAEFPLCPFVTSENALDVYSEKMKMGEIVSKTRWNQSRVQGVGNDGKGSLVVKCKMEDSDGSPSFKPWSIILIHLEDGKFAHQSYSTFFNEDGADKYFTILQGKEWTGGDVFDDYC